MPHFGGGAEGKVDVWNYDEGCGKCGVENLSAESMLRLARVKSRVPNRHSGLAGEKRLPIVDPNQLFISPVLEKGEPT